MARLLEAWANGYDASAAVTRLLMQQTGMPQPKPLPTWEEREAVFKLAASFQRDGLLKQVGKNNIVVLLIRTLDFLSSYDSEAGMLMSLYYLLKMDVDVLATLFRKNAAILETEVMIYRKWIHSYIKKLEEDCGSALN